MFVAFQQLLAIILPPISAMVKYKCRGRSVLKVLGLIAWQCLCMLSLSDLFLRPTFPGCYLEEDIF